MGINNGLIIQWASGQTPNKSVNIVFRISFNYNNSPLVSGSNVVFSQNWSKTGFTLISNTSNTYYCYLACGF